MSTNKYNVLYICHSIENKGGAFQSLLNMLRATRHDVSPIVLLPKYSSAAAEFENNGIPVVISYFGCNIWNEKKKFREIIRCIPHAIKEIVCRYRTLFKLRAVIKKYNINVIHSNTGAINIGYYISRRYKVKHVWHLREFQDLDFNWRPFWGWNNWYKMLNSSDAVICITDKIKKHFHQVNKPKVYKLWNAVRSVNELKPILYNKNDNLLFCASNIGEGKGLDTCLYALSKVIERTKVGHLDIIGRFLDKEYENHIYKIIHELDLDDHVTFIGYVSDISNYMLESRCFIMSSLNEALGRVTIEAMFYGCPVIGRNSGGTQELIIHGQNGFLFNNETELAKLIEMIYSTDLNEIINNGREFAVSNFSEESYKGAILSIYNDTFSK